MFLPPSEMLGRCDFALIILTKWGRQVDLWWVPDAVAMRIECVVVVDYESEEKAEAVLRSIAVDNGQYAQAVREGKRVTVKAAADSAPSLLHTVEDLMACLNVADDIVRQDSDPDALPDLDG
jgi:hypothetical protein